MWILFLLLSLINLLFIVNLVLLISGWTMLHVQVPAINWLNSKFKITTRYSITSYIHTYDKKYETTSDSDKNEEEYQTKQMDSNKISDDINTEEEESESNDLEVKNQLTQRKNMVLIDESLD
jgi:hypothetical protein